MPKIKEGFKVCRMRGYKPQSCYNDGRIVKYSYSKWTKRLPKCGPFAVFKRAEDAVEFCTIFGLFQPSSNNDFRQIFKCLYKESKEKILYDEEKRCRKTFDIPKGTVFADEVILVRVKWPHF